MATNPMDEMTDKKHEEDTGLGKSQKTDDEPSIPPEDVAALQRTLPPEKSTPWYGRDDIIMTNEEYFAECAKAMEGEKPLGDPPDIDDDEAFEKYQKEYEEYYKIYNKKTSDIFSRRCIGAQKEEYDWVRGGCKGEKPTSFSMLFLLGDVGM